MKSDNAAVPNNSRRHRPIEHLCIAVHAVKLAFQRWFLWHTLSSQNVGDPAQDTFHVPFAAVDRECIFLHGIMTADTNRKPFPAAFVPVVPILSGCRLDQRADICQH